MAENAIKQTGNDLPTTPEQLLAAFDTLGLSYSVHEHEPTFTVAESEYLKAPMPISARTMTARGLIPLGLVPAEYVSIRSGKSCFTIPAAIWLLAALAVHRKRTLILSFSAMDTSFELWNSNFHNKQQYSIVTRKLLVLTIF